MRSPGVRAWGHGSHIGCLQDVKTYRRGIASRRGHVDDHRDLGSKNLLHNFPCRRDQPAGSVDLNQQGIGMGAFCLLNGSPNVIHNDGMDSVIHNNFHDFSGSGGSGKAERQNSSKRYQAAAVHKWFLMAATVIYETAQSQYRVSKM